MRSLPGRGLVLVPALVALCAGTNAWAAEPRRDDELRDGKRGDPDLGWVGRHKEPNLTSEEINGLPENQRQAQRGGNVWTAATFGVFGVQDGAAASKPADFDHFLVTHPERPRGATAPE